MGFIQNVLKESERNQQSTVPMGALTFAANEIIRVLLLEDNPSDADLCIRKLKRQDSQFHVELARCSQEFLELVRDNAYDVILTDYRLPDWNGLDALHALRALGRDTPVVLVTGTLGDELAIECIKAGISDYVLKENLERLSIAVRRAISEHKLRQARDRAERDLRESEKQYRLLFEANPHPMWVFDRETLRFLTVNDAAIEHYGYSLNEFLSMSVRDIRPQDEIDRFPDAVGSSGRRLSYRELWKHRKKDGTVIDVEISSQTITFRAVEAVLVLAHDVTTQRRAEADLRNSKEQLQLLLDSTAEAIYAINEKGECTLCNPACLRLLGYVHESELLGKNMHAAMHHSRPDGSPYPVEQCKICHVFHQGKGTYETGEVFWRADGSSFPAEYWSYPIVHETRVMGSVITFFDITERKKAEEQLRRSEARYRSIIESAPYGIFRVDHNDDIVMANRALVAMLGYQRADEVLGHNIADVYTDPAERERVLDGFSSERSSLGQETKWIRKDKKSIVVRLAGRRFSSEDELSGGYEIFVEDITETKSLQKQFEHAQKMEAVGRLAGGVAHDFNNLLMVMSGYAQLLGESSRDAAKVVQYANQIREASSKAAGISHQLLAFSRKQVVDPAPLDLNFIVQDVGKMLPRLLGEDIDCVVALESELGTVRADRTQIEQVIMNLAVNAMDAMPKGGRLAIETRNVELEVGYDRLREVIVPPGRYVMLAVSDTGIGMSEEVRRHIFEPFFTTKEAGKGTGLGLATVYGIVKQNHGFIWVYSEPGQGSSFKVYFPRIDEAPAREQIEKSRDTPGGSETILLAEDDPSLRNVSRVYLESKGYTVLEAANAKEALRVCQNFEQPVDLLITDVVMPGLSGVELAQSALKLRPALALVLVSGYTDRILDIESIGIEANFLQKPFSLDALARLARSLLDNKRKRLI
jgi:two-component system, cell cycle sensor histidine kinase and response regulator CckA